MNPARAVAAFWLGPAPAERLAAVRALTGAFAVVYLLVRAPVLADFAHFAARDFAPVGLAHVLSAPLSNAAVLALYGLTLASGVAFTLGARFRVAAPLFALCFLALTSYRNSWGMVFHTDNLLALHLVALACSRAADAWSWDARGRAPAQAIADEYGWPLRLSCALTAVAYALAGIAKLKISGLDWMSGEILRNHIAYDALRKAQVGSVYSPLGGLLVQYSWPFPILGVLTMLLEVGAPLVLWHARLSRAWVWGIWSFHVGVLATMAIAFPYPLSLVAFASFFECERWAVVRWVMQKVRADA